jgi:pentapeptide MXKDX repeat protein
MKKILIAATVLTLMCGSAFAQGTGPSTQGDTMTKPGMNNDSMKKGAMDKGSTTKGTTGMNNGIKDPNATPNSDATSHGTVGPGSDSMKK